MRYGFFSTLLIFFLSVCSVEGGEPHTPTWTVKDALSVKNVTKVRASPNGDKLLYLVSFQDKGQWYKHLYITDFPDRRSTRIDFGEASISSPSWSQDGQSINFLAKGEVYQAVWRCSEEGENPSILFEIDDDIFSYKISPDQRYIAYVKEVPLQKEGEQVRHSTPLSTLQLWVATLNGDKKQRQVSSLNVQIQQNDFIDDYGYDWAPDSHAVVFCYAKLDRVLAEQITDLAVYDIDSRSSTAITDGKSKVYTPYWSKDGMKIAFNSDRELRHEHASALLGFSNIEVISPNGDERRTLGTSPDNSPILIGWTRDSKHLVIQDEEGIQFQLYRLGLDGKLESPFSTRRQVFLGVNINVTGTHIGCMEESFLDPPEAYRIPLDTGRSQKASNVQDISTNAIGRVEIVEWESDGRVIEGVLVLPPNYQEGDKSIPLVLFLHGGPQGAWTNSFIGSPTSFVVPECFGIYSSAGFAVLAPNFHGSTGYGPGFRRSNFKDFGGQDYRDVMSGVNYLVEKGIADPERLGVFGYSYGGYLSAWAITQTKRFKAAVCGAGITNLISFDGTSDITGYYLPGFLGTHYWEDPTLYLARSPIMFLGQVSTPTLIQYGAKDARVPPGQGQELYNGLKARSVPVELILYPDQGHVFDSPRMLGAALQDSLDWFVKWLGAGSH